MCVSVYNPIQIVFFFTASEVPGRPRGCDTGDGKTKGSMTDSFFRPRKKKKKNWRIVNMISNCHVHA